jgi:hypothetical protein
MRLSGQAFSHSTQFTLHLVVSTSMSWMSLGNDSFSTTETRCSLLILTRMASNGHMVSHIPQ